MSLRVTLRSPFAEPVVRDIDAGAWAEPSGAADRELGADLWALPGLADAHAHLAAAELDYQPGDLKGAMERARESLSAGVTLILDKGWGDDVTIRAMEALPESERPEIEAAARILAPPGGYFPGFAREVEAEDLMSAVGEEMAAGVGWVKLIGDWPRKGLGPVANFSETEMSKTVQLAETAGARVAIHTMAREVPSLAVAAGVHSIEHGLFLVEDDLPTLARRGGMWVPTILRCEATMSQLGESSSGGRLFAEGLAAVRHLLPLAAEAGVHVLAGTDLIGSPADVAAEAVALGRYGLSNAQAVRAVSSAAFAATGRDETFSVGTAANAVFFPDDPLSDLPVLRHPAHVMRLGEIR